ncbi:DUF4129 domain-containing protein [Halovivax sp.]|uniref:DUF4129 domain-containing protein n=1 Tax=Halovivax sp. TaxID=1935978 RepID=UPI0025BDE955|nr:DUF4129 domain-containing protein [Halovivax sp.]
MATAIVGVLALALAAATLPELVDVGTEGVGDGPNGDGEGPAEPGQPGIEEPGETQEGAPWFLEYLLLALVILVTGALAWYLVFERRELAKLAAVCLAVAAFVMFMIAIIGEDAAALVWEAYETEPPEEREAVGGGGGPGSDGTDLSTFELLILATAAAATIFAAGVLFSRHSPDGESDPGATADEEPTDVAGVGAVAGRTADRIESGADGGSLDNEVYRAWLEMTQLLDVDRPETATPGEFADAAIDAGLERHHVEELTQLFEEVRYGAAESTPEREERAVETLRRIEAVYGDDERDAVRVGDRG